MLLVAKIKIVIKDASNERRVSRCFCCQNPYFRSVITQIKILSSVLFQRKLFHRWLFYFSFIKRSEWRVIVVLVINITVMTLVDDSIVTVSDIWAGLPGSK